MVECESSKTAKNLDSSSVLIDTWWNVNFVRIADKTYGVKF